MPAKWKDLLAGLPDAIEEATESASRDAAEALNQAIRRIAAVHTVTDALGALVDSTPPYCAMAAILSLETKHARAIRVRGTAPNDQAIEIASAPALATLLDTKEPVAAAATAGELTESLAQTLNSPEGRVYLFPLKVRQEVVAALATAGSVQAGALECLCEAASLKLEILLPPAPPPAPVVKEIKKAPSAWDALSPEAQRTHLAAQRFARVKVAELRLYHADAVRDGRAKSDLYGALKPQIDPLRQEFEKEFATATPSMVDYLHLEILRSLAHDDDQQLGPNYPGPLI